MKRLLATALLCMATPAMACAPSPSCYMTESKAYLKSVCATEPKQTFEEIVKIHNDGELDKKQVERDVRRYITACKRLGYDIEKK